MSLVKAKKTKRNKGFSLIEVLVALFLMTLVFMVAVNTNFTNRQRVEEELTNIERAVRFSVSESALRNAIVRIFFKWSNDDADGDNQTSYIVEYGPNDNFVLPTTKLELNENMGLKEREEWEKDIKNFNKKFNKVREFQDSEYNLDPNVRLIGVGTNLSQGLIKDFQAAVYIYPTGEKDDAIIILGTEDEVISVEIDPFTLQMNRTYKTLEVQDIDDLYEKQDDIATEIYEEWLKN